MSLDGKQLDELNIQTASRSALARFVQIKLRQIQRTSDVSKKIDFIAKMTAALAAMSGR